MIKKTQGKLIFAKSASGDYQFIDINSYNLFNKKTQSLFSEV